MPRKKRFMIKNYHVIMICFISVAFLFSFIYVVISLVVYCTDEAMRAETRIQFMKNYYVAVVFLTK